METARIYIKAALEILSMPGGPSDDAVKTVLALLVEADWRLRLLISARSEE